MPQPARDKDKPFLMPVEDVFSISGRGTVATGRIERGVVKIQEEVEIVGIKDTHKTVVTGIEMFRKLLDQGEAGDNVGVLLRGVKREDVERGQVLAKPGSITPHKKFSCETYVLSKEEGGRHTPFFNGYRPQFYFRTTDVTGVAQVLVNGWKHAGGYDLKTGKELWKMATIGDIPTPTPYVAHDLIFLTNAHGGGIPVYAIKISAKGDISLGEDQTSNEYVAWSDPRGGSYMPTTVVYGDELYVLRDNGVFSCRDAKSGELHYKKRVGVGDGFTASLVAGDGKIYVTAETGEIAVVKAGKSFEKLAVNEIGEICMSAPAISAGRLYFRTRGHLVAIGKPEPKS